MLLQADRILISCHMPVSKHGKVLKARPETRSLSVLAHQLIVIL